MPHPVQAKIDHRRPTRHPLRFSHSGLGHHRCAAFGLCSRQQQQKYQSSDSGIQKESTALTYFLGERGTAVDASHPLKPTVFSFLFARTDYGMLRPAATALCSYRP